MARDDRRPDDLGILKNNPPFRYTIRPRDRDDRRWWDAFKRLAEQRIEAVFAERRWQGRAYDPTKGGAGDGRTCGRCRKVSRSDARVCGSCGQILRPAGYR